MQDEVFGNSRGPLVVCNQCPPLQRELRQPLGAACEGR